MKKVFIIIVYVLFGVSMSACNTSTSEEPTTTEQPTTVLTTSPPTTQTTTQITFTPVASATVEIDQASFFVQIDSNTINDLNPVITVAVEITAKKNISIELPTTTYGEEGIIEIRVVSVDNSEIYLFSDIYGVDVNASILDVHVDSNDSLTRTMQFARMPFHGGSGGEEPSPTGTYKIQVALYAQEMVWIDTGLLITVE